METRIALIALGLLALAPLANASDEAGFYAGSGAGLYYVDLDGIDFDETAGTVRAFGGYKLNDYVAFEVGYAVLLESSAGIAGADVDVDGNALDISVRPTFPLADNIDLFGIVGYSRYEFDVSASFSGISASDSDSENDLFYGVGAQIDLTDNWAVRGEWATYDVDDADFGIFGVSATYRFR